FADSKSSGALRWNDRVKEWSKLEFSFPPDVSFVNANGTDNGLRFVDIDEDGFDDIVFSNAERFGVYLFSDMQTGWSRTVVEETRHDPEAGGTNVKTVPQEQRGATHGTQPGDLPPIVRAHGTDN